MEKNKNNRKIRKVLLLAAKFDFARFIPLGIAYIAACCEKEGYSVKIYDELPGDNNNLANTLKEFFPDIVGISCMTATYTKACQYATEIKKMLPQIPIVFGGVHPTVSIEETLRNPFVDFVVFGEGEETFIELLKKYDHQDFFSISGLAYKDGGKIYINECRPLTKKMDDFPMPARHLFSMDYYRQRWNWPRGHWYRTANMMSSRGCVYDCIFCGSKSMFGRTFRAFSIKRTVDEIELLVKKYGFECISFSDDTFAIDKSRAIGICEEIRRRNIQSVYRFKLRADTCNEDLISMLRRVGCIHIDIGAESGSDKILKLMKKGITVQDIKNAINTIKKYKINIGVTFIIGSPGETMEDINATKELAKEIDADYTQFFVMVPYPGTELYTYAKENNLMPADLTYFDFRHGGEDLKPFLNSIISPKKIANLRDELNKTFADKIAFNYLMQPHFISDLLLIFANNPHLLIKFLRKIIYSRNFGSSLKSVLPQKL